MRRDVTELKKLVHDIMAERGGTSVVASHEPVHYIQEAPVKLVHDAPVVMTSVPSVTPLSEPVVKPAEAQEVDDVEKEMIRKALERHHGKRKNAANDLKISERTLYRKIKEYGLD